MRRNTMNLGRWVSRLALLAALAAALPAWADVRPLKLAAYDIVYDPSRGKMYASVSAGPVGPLDSVAVIDPESGAVGPFVPVGGEPGALALSDDGRFLYV